MRRQIQRSMRRQGIHLLWVAVAVLASWQTLAAAPPQQRKTTSQTSKAAAGPLSADGPVKGSGTTNVIPIWTSSSTIGNSAISQSQSGSNVSVSGSVSAASFAALSGGLSTTGDTSVGGNLSVTGSLTGNTATLTTVNSTNPYQIGGAPVLSVGTPSADNLFVGLGAGALQSNTTGFQNTASGVNALQLNTGNDNTASGVNALQFNTTGSFNTASGFEALLNNTMGSNNTASGGGALLSNTTGSDNTVVGFQAGFNVPTGNGNLLVGENAGGAFMGSESHNIDIGNTGAINDQGFIRIGAAGIQTATYIAGITGVTTGSPTTTSTVLVDGNGQLGTIASSRRYKEDIHDMGAASDGLLRLRPVTFRYKKAYADGAKPIQYGLVAEEVAEVYPDLVVRGKDGQVETVQYYKLDAMLLNELQKLAQAHAADQERIAELEAQTEKLQSQVAEQRQQGQEQQAAMRQLLAQVRVIQATLARKPTGRSRLRVAKRTVPAAGKSKAEPPTSQHGSNQLVAKAGS